MFFDLVRFFLVVKHAVTVALKIGVGDLLTELLADAFIVLGALHSAGTVAALGLEAVLYHFYYFFVFVKSDLRFHRFYSFVFVKT